MPNVSVFWDNSNMFVPARDIAQAREGGSAAYSIRIHFENLYRLAHAGRTVSSAFCVGSVPPQLQAVWNRLRATGVEVELFERGQESRTEQAVDQALQVQMLRTLADQKPPGVAVLLTGDGAGYYSGRGFHADLERLANGGWGIEVISWDGACNERLRAWAKAQGVYVPLENYYDSITFIEGGRGSRPLSLTRRPKAQVPDDPS